MKQWHMTVAGLLIFLLIGAAPPAFGAGGKNNVRQAQGILKTMGYKPGPADGIMGKKTHTAVKRFQKDHGLPVTGKLDKKTLDNLLKQACHKGRTGTATKKAALKKASLKKNAAKAVQPPPVKKQAKPVQKKLKGQERPQSAEPVIQPKEAPRHPPQG